MTIVLTVLKLIKMDRTLLFEMYISYHLHSIITFFNFILYKLKKVCKEKNIYIINFLQFILQFTIRYETCFKILKMFIFLLSCTAKIKHSSEIQN